MAYVDLGPVQLIYSNYHPVKVKYFVPRKDLFSKIEQHSEKSDNRGDANHLCASRDGGGCRTLPLALDYSEKVHLSG